jgi:hypothetical protein
MYRAGAWFGCPSLYACMPSANARSERNFKNAFMSLFQVVIVLIRVATANLNSAPNVKRPGYRPFCNRASHEDY